VSPIPLATRSSQTIHEQATSVEGMRTAGRPVTHVKREVRSTGESGWSPLLCPGPATRESHPSLAYLWALGPPAAAPYDPMHVFLGKVVPSMWRLATGVMQAEPDVVDNYVVSSKIAEQMGVEYRSAARTVPADQARNIRDIHKHHAGFKAADWLYFLLCNAEVLLFRRVPEDI